MNSPPAPPLHGFEFEQLFDKVEVARHFYAGVYSVDEIPKEIKTRQFVVVNLSPKSEPGTHWFVISRSDQYLYEIFNSLGFESVDELAPHLSFDSHADIVFNGERFQAKTSTSCGYFCVFYAIHRVLNYDMSFHHLLDFFFDHDSAVNEDRVIKFCQRLKSDNPNLFDEY